MPEAQTHSLPTDLSDRELAAYWSARPEGKLLLFVHGFGGKPQGTWMQFPSLLLREPRCAGVDFLFYGYDGLRSRAAVSAAKLYRFIDDLFTDPASVAHRSGAVPAARIKGPPTKEILLVAHSLGAAVCRRALLNAQKEGKLWLASTSFVLFAPAHRGADFLKLAKVALFSFPLGSLATSLVLHRLAALQDLELQSEFIRDLLRDTKALSKTTRKYHVARAVIFGEHENIVNPNSFCEDPVHIIYDRKDHFSVCKPDENFRKTLT